MRGEGEREPTGQAPLGRQTPDQHRHQRLVRHRVNDAADDRLQPPPPRQPAVDEVGRARIREERHRGRVLLGQHEVAQRRRGEQAREGQEVREVVDVLVRGGGED